jgi:hypothetical protein
MVKMGLTENRRVSDFLMRLMITVVASAAVGVFLANLFQ